MSLGIGALLLLIGMIWMIVLSVQLGTTTAEKVIWAIANFLFQPIAGIVFFIVKKSGLVPLILILIGVVFYGYGLFTSLGDIMQQLK